MYEIFCNGLNWVPLKEHNHPEPRLWKQGLGKCNQEKERTLNFQVGPELSDSVFITKDGGRKAMINQSDVGDIATSQTKQKSPGAKREGRTPARPQECGLAGYLGWSSDFQSFKTTNSYCLQLSRYRERHTKASQETWKLNAWRPLWSIFPSKSQLRC